MENEYRTKLCNAIMGELDCLVGQTTGTANYWLDSAHNVFADTVTDGRETWFEVKLELYDPITEDWIGDLTIFATEDTSEQELRHAVEYIVDKYLARR